MVSLLGGEDKSPTILTHSEKMVGDKGEGVE